MQKLLFEAYDFRGNSLVKVDLELKSISNYILFQDKLIEQLREENKLLREENKILKGKGE